MDNVCYRRASMSDLSLISDVHLKCFPDSFSSKFGRYLLSNYYGEFIKEGAPFFVAIYNSDIIGFCMGYYSGTCAKDNFVKKNILRLLIKSLKLFIYNERWTVIKNFLYYVRLYNPIKKRHIKDLPSHAQNGKDADLLSICVIERYRGCGVSTSLIVKFEEELSKESVVKCSLSVAHNNIIAINFYKKMGYRIIRKEDRSYVLMKYFEESNKL